MSPHRNQARAPNKQLQPWQDGNGLYQGKHHVDMFIMYPKPNLHGTKVHNLLGKRGGYYDPRRGSRGTWSLRRVLVLVKDK